MTAREPSAVEVIAEAVRRHRLREVGGGTATGSRWTCYCGESDVTPGVREHAVTLHSRHVADTTDAALKAAGFVVATRYEIRAMSPSEQAELIGGEVVDVGEGFSWAVGPAVPNEPVCDAHEPWDGP